MDRPRQAAPGDGGALRELGEIESQAGCNAGAIRARDSARAVVRPRPCRIGSGRIARGEPGLPSRVGAPPPFLNGST